MYSKTIERTATHLEELKGRIDSIEGGQFKKPLVHIIDREGDSVQLMRALEGRKCAAGTQSSDERIHHEML